jgi:hypothetical protein
MRIRLLPRPFFIGLAVGLTALSWLGATVQSRYLVENFGRFHRLINVETGYYPTARQALAVARPQAPATPAIDVVIGGSSVFHGVSQHASLMWTRVLQDLLGPQFRVVNLAQRAGAVDDFGNIVAEHLLREGRQVIYVADGRPSGMPLMTGQSFYRHIVLDAWSRGYLFPWPPRDDFLSGAKWSGLATFRAAAWGAMLDRYLNFNDFWNFISYDFAGINWNSVLRTDSIHPRRSLVDSELLPEQYERIRFKNPLDVEMGIVRRQIEKLRNPSWREAVKDVERAIPPQLRSVSLAVVQLESSYYINRLSAQERATLFASADEHVRLLSGIGFAKAVVIGKDFIDDHHVDRIHMSVVGGRKLAAELAPIVRSMATELGYLK